MPEFTYTLPTGGEARNLSDGLIKTALTKLKEPTLDNTNLSASAGIKGTQLSASAAIADTQLASPNNGAYRYMLLATGLVLNNVSANSLILTNSTVVVSGATGGLAPMPYIYFDDADFTVASKTQKMRLRAQIAVNGTKASIKFTFGMYPITVSGGSNEYKITLGTVVSGSTVEINEPTANTISQAVGSDFTIPADGAYALGVVTSGSTPESHRSALSAQLQSRSV